MKFSRCNSTSNDSFAPSTRFELQRVAEQPYNSADHGGHRQPYRDPGGKGWFWQHKIFPRGSNQLPEKYQAMDELGWKDTFGGAAQRYRPPGYGEDPDVILLSLESAASGSNMTQANHVIFVHPMNSPTVERGRDKVAVTG